MSLTNNITPGENNILQDKVGLIQGKMGDVIYNYLMLRLTSNNEYKQAAELLLDKVVQELPDLFNISFDRGLAGIGYAIEYLIQNQYIDGDSNEILAEFDDKIFRMMNDSPPNDLELGSGLVGYLMYFLARQENKSDELMYKVNLTIVKKLTNTIADLVPHNADVIIQDTVFDLISPFTFVLRLYSQLLNMDINKVKIYQSLKYWKIYYANFQPNLHSNRLNWALTLFILNTHLVDNEIDSIIRTILYSIDIEKIEYYEIETETICIRHSWIGIILVLNELIDLIDKGYPNYQNLIILKEKLIKKYKDSVDEVILLEIINKNTSLGLNLKDRFPSIAFLEIIILYREDRMHIEKENAKLYGGTTLSNCICSECSDVTNKVKSI